MLTLLWVVRKKQASKTPKNTHFSTSPVLPRVSLSPSLSRFAVFSSLSSSPFYCWTLGVLLGINTLTFKPHLLNQGFILSSFSFNSGNDVNHASDLPPSTSFLNYEVSLLLRTIKLPWYSNISHMKSTNTDTLCVYFIRKFSSQNILRHGC